MCNTVEEAPPKLDSRRSTASSDRHPWIAASRAREISRARSELVLDDGGHTLISASQALSDATVVLPVVSTLVFGFAVTEMLNLEREARSALLLLCISAASSLYTTTYSVLEYHYISLLRAADARSNYLLEDTGCEDERRDHLARRADALIVRLEPWREASRNSLWVSVMSILAAAGTQILLSAHHSLPLWIEVLVLGVLLGGTVLVPLTVRHFRRSFRPLLDEYHIRQPLRPQHDYHRHSEPEEEEEPYSA